MFSGEQDNPSFKYFDFPAEFYLTGGSLPSQPDEMLQKPVLEIVTEELNNERKRRRELEDELKNEKEKRLRKEQELESWRTRAKQAVQEAINDKKRAEEALVEALEAPAKILERKKLLGECYICNEDSFHAELNFVTPPCGHILCTGCMENLEKHKKRKAAPLMCPACKAKMTRKIFIK